MIISIIAAAKHDNIGYTNPYQHKLLVAIGLLSWILLLVLFSDFNKNFVIIGLY